MILVRHAHAGSKKHWSGPDEARPLSGLGCEQAASLARRLAVDRVEVVWSSPAVRCLQTVRPLAEQRGLTVCSTPLLSKSGSARELLAWLHDAGQAASWVVCSHGEVFDALHAQAQAAGLPELSPADAMDKGSAWRLGRTPVYLAPEPAQD
ncbi:MAG: phosphoglycerate mutase family protein [Mycobacteriaceae bacterium]